MPSVEGNTSKSHVPYLPDPVPCSICEEATRSGNEAVSESFDNFQRYYLQPLVRSNQASRPGTSAATTQKLVPYRYTALAARSHTRLLVVQAGQNEYPLRCSMQEVDIDDPPSYTAMSYTWGTPGEKKTIDVDGQSFMITDNLWHALLHIRLSDRPFTIWIDALCINQNDIDERNHVVRRMRDIYERATGILAWLGPESHNGAASLLAMASIYDGYVRLVDKFGTRKAALQQMLAHKSWAGEEQTAAADKQWWSVERLFSRTWFHRMWIVQEGTTPVPTTFQLCRYKVPTESVFEVFRILQFVPENSFPRNIVQTPMHIQTMGALTSLAKKRQKQHAIVRAKQSRCSGKNAVSTNTQGLPLLEILELVRNHSSSDPHDKVYAALGFAASDHTDLIDIDFRKRLCEMLRDVAVSCLKQKRPLRLLGHAGLLGVKDMYTPFYKDSSHSSLLEPQALYDACNMDHPIWKEKAYVDLRVAVHGNTLSLPGIFVDYVSTVSVLVGDSQHMESLETAWIVQDMENIYAPTGELRETAYLKTLVADLDMKDQEVIGRGGSMYWRDGSYKPLNHSDVELVMRNTCTGRRFIQTLKHKYLGVGPFFALKGDAIFMLKDGEMLYLARPTLNGTYHFVGEVYVHGMMDGAVVESFSRGQGTLQMVEFVPVTNEVLDSTKPGATEAVGGLPFTQKTTNVAFNVRVKQLKNPNDDMDVYVHRDVGPRVDDLLQEMMSATVMSCLQQGLSQDESFRQTIIDGHWADVAEQTLLAKYPIHDTASSSRISLAGRDYARRSYIRAAIAQEKLRIVSQLLAQGKNVMADREVLAITADFEKDLEVSCEESAETHFEHTNKDEQLTADEALAQLLQAEEYKDLDMSAHGRGPSTPQGPSPYPYTSSSLNVLTPLRYPRVGPPVRLCQAPSHNSCTWRYNFQNPSDYLEYADDVKKYTAIHPGPPPVLFGRWVTDPKKRPQVELTAFGTDAQLWWEDEEGNRVAGPDEGVEWRGRKIEHISTMSSSGVEGGWTEKDSLKSAYRRGTNQTIHGKKLGKDGNGNTGGGVSWEEAVRFGGWEDEDEAHAPTEFLLM